MCSVPSWYRWLGSLLDLMAPVRAGGDGACRERVSSNGAAVLVLAG